MDKKDSIVTEPGAANDNNEKSKNNENETNGTNNDDNVITGVTGNEIKLEGKKEKKDGGNKMEDNPNGKKGNDERQSSTTLASIPEVGKTHASGNIILNEGTEQLDGNSKMREKLIRKIEELENQKKSLKQRQLIKEIETLQTEVQTNYEDETKGPDTSFKASDKPVIPNSVAPMATEIEDQARIDMQLKELNQKIEKASKHIDERKKQEDLSSFSADELQTKVQELKRRKELLSKFKQKEQVITLIQDLHKQVSTMKKNVKSKDDRSTASIMSGPTVNFVLEEPDFYIAYATASITSDSSNSSNSSFLDTLMRHLRSKYEKKDLQSILEDVKREIMCSTDNYETLQSLTTLRQPVFFGHQMSISEQ